MLLYLDKTIKYILSVILCFLILDSVQSQDIHFSNITNSPLFYNVAFSGYSNYNRLGILHRNQWRYPTNSEPYNTNSLWGDLKIPNCQNYNSKLIDQDWIGIGGQIIHDAAGDANLTTLSENLSFAYHFGLKNGVLSFGAGTGLNQKRIDKNSLYFENQWTGYGFNQDIPNYENSSLGEFIFPSYFDLKFGTILTIQPAKKEYRFNIGFAVNNIIFQKNSFYESGNNVLFPRKNIHASYFGKFKSIYFEPFLIHSNQNTSYQTIFGLKLHQIFHKNLSLTFLSRIGGFSEFDNVQRDFLFDISLKQKIDNKNEKKNITIEYSFCTDINTINNIYQTKPSKTIISPELCIKAYFNKCSTNHIDKAPGRIESGRNRNNIKERTPIKPNEVFRDICERLKRKEKYRLKGKRSFTIEGGFGYSLSSSNFATPNFAENTGIAYSLNMTYLSHFYEFLALGFEINPSKYENTVFVPLNLKAHLNISFRLFSIYSSTSVGYSLEFHSSFPGIMFNEMGGIFAREGIGLMKFIPNRNMAFSIEAGYQFQQYLIEYFETNNLSNGSSGKIIGEIPMPYLKVGISFYFRKRH
ncbi:MAG: PorP/SprF family type IX secretion system membrane protein [Bacteroidetes bacterium]|nr:PorP/SprF family type IX secretion system membrane protein [Bacteroidota bacterium]MBT6685910.1 PorP/SprF family type IX secretion system membrane protein [Bacteroidota bacterium]MBT7143129.1 PorP/SprF family type IX secretion system membrane protein [Bacteroidota bacterium]MBT7491655.1 PorP/SprF family type IX secretion system membrane protein [Bacteroidota bacterium]